jgi:hypothetical protein
MGVLLLPVLGLFPSDPFYRGRNAVILLLGMLRWMLASAALWMMLTPFALVFASIGTGVLWRSAVWGSRQLGGSPRLTPTTTYTPEK